MRLHLTRPSATTVIAVGALVLATTTGTAFAATKLADNSVGTPQLQNNAVTYKKIGDGEVGYAKLTPGVQGDLNKTGAQGPQGATGATGPQGPKGDTGATGAELEACVGSV